MMTFVVEQKLQLEHMVVLIKDFWSLAIPNLWWSSFGENMIDTRYDQSHSITTAMCPPHKHKSPFHRLSCTHHIVEWDEFIPILSFFLVTLSIASLSTQQQASIASSEMSRIPPDNLPFG